MRPSVDVTVTTGPSPDTTLLIREVLRPSTVVSARNRVTRLFQFSGWSDLLRVGDRSPHGERRGYVRPGRLNGGVPVRGGTGSDSDRKGPSARESLQYLRTSKVVSAGSLGSGHRLEDVVWT